MQLIALSCKANSSFNMDAQARFRTSRARYGRIWTLTPKTDADTRVAFLLLTFLWRSKRKVSRPPRRQSGTGTLQSACSFE